MIYGILDAILFSNAVGTKADLDSIYDYYVSLLGYYTS